MYARNREAECFKGSERLSLDSGGALRHSPTLPFHPHPDRVPQPRGTILGLVGGVVTPFPLSTELMSLGQEDIFWVLTFFRLMWISNKMLQTNVKSS